jgi:hypothetical protein
MKKIMMVFILALVLINCDSRAIEKPENLISEDQMVAILYDLYVLNAVKANNNDYLRERKTTPSKYIYSKYKIDSLQFAKSDNYYASDLDDYEKLYQRVTKRLEQNKAEMDSLIKKNPEPKKPALAKPVSSPVKISDSLRKKRSILNPLLKENTKN